MDTKVVDAYIKLITDKNSIIILRASLIMNEERTEFDYDKRNVSLVICDTDIQKWLIKSWLRL